MPGKARVGVVGVGLHGEMHLAAYSSYDRCRLTCVCDLNAERAQEMATKYGCDWTTDLAELASAVDAVSIVTPDFAHLEPGLAMLAADKHVLMEKPLTTDPSEAERLVSSAQEHNLKLMVNFSNRWNPKYLAGKEAYASGQLGEFVMGYSRLSNTISVPTSMVPLSAYNRCRSLDRRPRSQSRLCRRSQGLPPVARD